MVRGVLWVLLLAASGAFAASNTVDFNRDIRPILSDKCYTCHGPDPANRKTQLRFDTEAGASIELRGHRHAVVPGHPNESELYRRVTSQNKGVRMPPAYMGRDRLSDHDIDLLRRWIEQGAKWEKHWSLIPPRQAPLPEVKDSAWPANPIDRFVLAHLEHQGLHPSPEADRATLIRRVTLDLTGLPPTEEEVSAFLADHSANAWEKVVDRLLASPRYAERMAEQWLDAARYADTNGYQTDGPRDMWRWRDWVIDAFARNMPFDQFTIDQLAGDLLPHPTLDQVIATGFNRNHRTSGEGGIIPEEFRTEYVAERTATLGTVWLGLTIGCARCHDHKYDPIPQRDFYRLFAYFNNVPEKGLVYNFGNEEPFVKAPTPAERQQLDALDSAAKDAASRFDALQPALAAAQQKWERSARKNRRLDWSVDQGLVLRLPDGQAGDSLPEAAAPSGGAWSFDGTRFLEHGQDARFDYLDPFTLAAWVKPSAPNGAIITRNQDYFESEGYALYLLDGKIRFHIIKRWTDIGLRVETEDRLPLNQWHHVSVTYDGHRYASGVRIYVDGRPQKIKVLFDELNYPLEGKAPFRVGGGGGAKLRFHGQIGGVRVYRRALTAAEAGTLPVTQSIAEIAALAPAARTPAQSDKLRLCFLERFAPKRIRQAQSAMEQAQAARQKFYDAIPTVMVMKELPTPRPTFVLKRGAYDAPLQRVTAGVPEILPPLKPGWPNNRLGLARWLVDRSNPLTARVIVNRYWQMYFGTGLVKTVEDFGSQGELPAYQDLLDWLAVRFMDSGWNVKAMQKLIVTSATYRQSSATTPAMLERDPENRLLARGPRFRLSAEAIRDQALDIAGLLVEQVGGPPVKPYQPPGLWKELSGGKDYQQDHGPSLYRRSLYTYWRRTVAPPAMVLFDAPDREVCAVRQVRTNTPLQALDLMNDVTYVEAARKFGERMMREGGRTPEERLAWGWRLALARAPRPAEERVLLDTFRHFAGYYQQDSKAAALYLAAGESPRARKLRERELAAYTGVASLILNLDETITKE